MTHFLDLGFVRLYVETRFLFEPRDLWIGVYWKTWPQAIAFYVCLLPTVPLYLYVQRYPGYWR
jgi:hypothetical protein